MGHVCHSVQQSVSQQAIRLGLWLGELFIEKEDKY
jgi:hypothetical protein